MKQTAVDWLIIQLNKFGFTEVLTDEEIQQAKEIEKQIIDDAYLCGLNRGVEFQQSQEMGVLCEWPSDRDYYEETFNIKEE
jgi:hypothetical protein